MDYKKDDYYLIKENNRLIRILNNDSQDIYKFYDLLSKENKKYFPIKLKFINNENEVEEINSSPFINLSLTDCNFLKLEKNNYIVNSSVNLFLNKIVSDFNSSLILIYKEGNYFLEGSRLKEFNIESILLNDTINDFFNKIELLKIPLTIKQKDDFVKQLI